MFSLRVVYHNMLVHLIQNDVESRVYIVFNAAFEEYRRAGVIRKPFVRLAIPKVDILPPYRVLREIGIFNGRNQLNINAFSKRQPRDELENNLLLMAKLAPPPEAVHFYRALYACYQARGAIHMPEILEVENYDWDLNFERGLKFLLKHRLLFQTDSNEWRLHV